MDLGKIEAFARAAHAGQFRRDGVTPYIHHPLAVARLANDNAEAQAAALLHDVVEDTGVKPSDLIGLVTHRVLSAVTRLTHRKGEPYDRYIDRLRGCPLAVHIKIADITANLLDTPTERQVKKYVQALIQLGQH